MSELSFEDEVFVRAMDGIAKSDGRDHLTITRQALGRMTEIVRQLDEACARKDRLLAHLTVDPDESPPGA